MKKEKAIKEEMNKNELMHILGGFSNFDNPNLGGGGGDAGACDVTCTTCASGCSPGNK